MAIISTEAIVLRSIPHRETSQIAFFFTQKCGKVIGVLKGIRKNPRKFGSSVDKFSVNNIVFYQYRNSDIHLVSQCDMKEFFPALCGHIRKITAGEYACELVNKIMPVEERNPKVFDLLLYFFRTLGREKDVARLVHMFQVKILALSGFRPHIDSCVRCGCGIKAQARFSLSRGGLICQGCEMRDMRLVNVSKGAVATLLYLERQDWASCQKLKISPGIKQELRQILNNFLTFHLEKHIRSARYLPR